MAEFVPGLEATIWNGFSDRETNAALADPKLVARMVELGAMPPPGSTANHAKLIADDTEKWAKVVKWAVGFREAKPRNLRTFGLATALLASLTLS